MGRELRHWLRHAHRRERRRLPAAVPLTAKLNQLTIKVDRPPLPPEEIKKLEAGMKQAADAK